MRIFFPNATIRYPPHDGPHVHVYQLTRYLVARGHEVITLDPDENPVTTKWRRTARSVWQAIRSADAIYCRPAERPAMSSHLTGWPWRAAIPRRCAVVWEQNRSLTVSLMSKKRTPREIAANIKTFRRLAGRVDAAIGVAAQVTEELQDLLGIRYAFTIQNGSDPGMFRPGLLRPPELRLRDGHLQVGWIGSHVNSVHNSALIEAAASTAEQRLLRVQFHVIGDTRRMFSNNPPANMHFHGAVPYDKLPGYLSSMDVGLAVYNERIDGGSPLKLFDYMASGCVPICSPGDAMQDVIGNEGVGFIDEWTPESLCSQLAALAKAPELQANMGTRARKLVEDEYSWDRIADKVETVIQEAINRRRILENG